MLAIAISLTLAVIALFAVLVIADGALRWVSAYREISVKIAAGGTDRPASSAIFTRAIA